MFATAQPLPVEVPVQASRDEALEALFQEQYPKVVRLAYLLTSDAGVAEELAQEAFVRTWRAWGRIRNPQVAPAYLRKAVVNLARSSLRRRLLEARHRSARADDGREHDPGLRLDVLDALRHLPPRQRACVTLRYYEDLSEQETARTLGVSVGTVKSTTHKALRRLETLLGGEA